MGQLASLLFVGIPTHLEGANGRALPAALSVSPHHLLVGLDCDEAIADTRRHVGRFGPKAETAIGGKVSGNE